MHDQILTQERLKEVLHYSPESGVFTWEKTLGSRAQSGDIAGGVNHGYIRIKIDGRMYQAHQLAFLYMMGRFPVGIDHENHIKSDNRWTNLSEATQSENCKNISKKKNNTSGTTGVAYLPHRKKWRAQIMVNWKTIIVAYTSDFNEAVALRKAAEKKYGFHPNHGK